MNIDVKHTCDFCSSEIEEEVSFFGDDEETEEVICQECGQVHEVVLYIEYEHEVESTSKFNPDIREEYSKTKKDGMVPGQLFWDYKISPNQLTLNF